MFYHDLFGWLMIDDDFDEAVRIAQAAVDSTP
jgi:hypothetical protein